MISKTIEEARRMSGKRALILAERIQRRTLWHSLSASAYDRIFKVARASADLAGEDSLVPEGVAEPASAVARNAPRVVVLAAKGSPPRRGAGRPPGAPSKGRRQGRTICKDLDKVSEWRIIMAKPI
jgi:hypothetical protein